MQVEIKYLKYLQFPALPFAADTDDNARAAMNDDDSDDGFVEEVEPSDIAVSLPANSTVICLFSP